jgi:formiminoglutamate deiminase
MSSWFAEYAMLPAGLARDVRFEIVDGRFAAVEPGAGAAGAQCLPGIALPGFANCHSHAFHRALRGRTHDDTGTFWSWRARMYELAAQLDPDRYRALARATYAEMALAGVTSVAEFHYLHHDPAGHPYADVNAMGAALRDAAREAGIRLTLLDACYLAGGLTADGHSAPDDVQRRFSDADVDAWAERVAQLDDDDITRVGVAAHSVRAVPQAALRVVAELGAGRPMHVHVSEQPAENDACLAHYRRTPTALLAECGMLGPQATAVHATHVSDDDIGCLSASGTSVCLCPSTERDLADGLGRAGPLAAAGVPLSIGTDQQTAVDPIGEARGVEEHERLRTGRRGRFAAGELLAMLTRHDTIGWPDAGRLAVHQRADLVAVRLDSVRTAGAQPGQLLFAASAADVDTVLVDGRPVVRGGTHLLGDIGPLLREAIEAAWRS